MSASITDKVMLVDILHPNSGRIKSFGVKRLGLFGSFVRNTADLNSDVDLLVVFE